MFRGQQCDFSKQNTLHYRLLYFYYAGKGTLSYISCLRWKHGRQLRSKFAGNAMSRAGVAEIFKHGSILPRITRIGLEEESLDDKISILSNLLFAVGFQFSAIKYLASLNHFLDCVSTECIPQRHIRSKDEVDFVTFDQSQSQRCPVHTRPPHKRICSFLQRKNPNCFPYTYLTEEHPTEHSDQFSIYLCINVYVLCFMGHPLLLQQFGVVHKNFVIPVCQKFWG